MSTETEVIMADLQARLARLEERIADLEQGDQPEPAGEVWGFERHDDEYGDAEVIQS